MRGEWRILERDAETLEVTKERCVCNVVTDAALSKFAQGVYDPRQLVQSYTWYGHSCPTRYKYYWYIVLGTGTGVPAPSDTGLYTPTDDTSRNCSKIRTGGEIRYYQRYMPEVINGPTYTEAGIYEWVPRYSWWDDEGGEHFTPRPYNYGTLLNHALLDPPLEKTELKLMDFEIRVTFY